MESPPLSPRARTPTLNFRKQLSMAGMPLGNKCVFFWSVVTLSVVLTMAYHALLLGDRTDVPADIELPIAAILQTSIDRLSSAVCYNRNQPCLKHHFANMLLIIVYNHPHYDSVELLREYYEAAFPNIFFCGPPGNDTKDSINYLQIQRGVWGYECLSEAIRRHPTYKGYFYINDDVVLNYWNLVGTRFTESFIWESNNRFGQVDLAGSMPSNWYWWVSPYGWNNTVKAVNEIQELATKFKFFDAMYKQYVSNGHGKHIAYNGRSDIIYIPAQFALKFQELSKIFHRHQVFLEIAVPTILRFLAPATDIFTLDGHYIPGDVRKNDPRVVDSRYFWVLYLNNPGLWFIHPFKLQHRKNKNRELNLALMTHLLIERTRRYTECLSPDDFT